MAQTCVNTALLWLRHESNSDSRFFGYDLFFRALTLLIDMTDTNPPQERGATDPQEDRRRQLMAALTREVSDESNDEQPDDSGRVRLTEDELRRGTTEYDHYRALRRPLLPARFEEGRGGRQLSRR